MFEKDHEKLCKYKYGTLEKVWRNEHYIIRSNYLFFS